MHPDREPTVAWRDDPLCEQQIWAEHRAALDATLFAGETLELELCDGALRPR